MKEAGARMKTKKHNDESGDYGLVRRLKALRDLLESGNFTKQEIFKALPHCYPSAHANNRRLSRDINALRQLGYPVAVDRPQYTYSIKRKSTLILEDSDITALNLIQNTFSSNPPIATAILPVMKRIINALPKRQLSMLSKQPPISIALKPAVDYSPFIQTIHLLERAIQKGQKVQFIYPSLDDGHPIKHVGVEPYEIQFFENHFYLIGITPQAFPMMEFRINRIREPIMMPGRSAHSRKRPTITFTYKLPKKIVRQGISERFLNQKVEVQTDGSAIIHAEGYSEFRIIQGILKYGEQAEILEPENLRKNMRKIVEAMRVLYTR